MQTAEHVAMGFGAQVDTLRDMKIVLTNDDGFGAPGLEALTAAAQGLGHLTVIAPHTALSGCSHRVTTDSPLRFSTRGPDAHSVEGTPADCVRVALHRLVPEFDWVLSGINSGGNLGADVYYSGTVAAAREAVLHGRPAIALSHYRRRAVPVDWMRAAAWIAPLLAKLMKSPWSAGLMWNINLPHLDPGAPDPAIVFCGLDPSPLPLSYRHEEHDLLHYDGNYHLRQRVPDKDVALCLSGNITVTELRLY